MESILRLNDIAQISNWSTEDEIIDLFRNQSTFVCPVISSTLGSLISVGTLFGNGGKIPTKDNVVAECYDRLSRVFT